MHQQPREEQMMLQACTFVTLKVLSLTVTGKKLL
jgi:hypothetical protein